MAHGVDPPLHNWVKVRAGTVHFVCDISGCWVRAHYVSWPCANQQVRAPVAAARLPDAWMRRGTVRACGAVRTASRVRRTPRPDCGLTRLLQRQTYRDNASTTFQVTGRYDARARARASIRRPQVANAHRSIAFSNSSSNSHGGGRTRGNGGGRPSWRDLH